ncbi:c-type cytochrome [Ilumatobacter sp.]|uniref:c-type cytochrome n=1 Tax=Ilumatobacter sp. TaxID=1967498 RepID=UPI003AF9D90B
MFSPAKANVFNFYNVSYLTGCVAAHPTSRTLRERRAPVGTMTPHDTDHAKPPLWRRHTTIAATVTVIIAIAAASCGSNETDTTPADPAGVGEGAALYQTHCASCHGADLRGSDKGPSHLSIVYEPNHHGDDAFRSAIINGAQQHHWSFGDMAPIPGLDDDQIDAIIDYVRAEQQREGFEP